MIFEKKLPNGIRLVGEQMPNSRAVSLGIWFCAGSANENEKQAGLAHFIEHMMFKGTPTRTALQIAAEVDFYGGQMNAFTAKECTQYSIKSTDDMLEKSMDILSDIICNPLIDSVELEKEKGVVLEEISMVEDTPDDVVIDRLVCEYFDNSPLGKPILGNAPAIKEYTRDDLLAFIEQYYVAQNCVIAVAGNFVQEDFENLCLKYFGNLRTGQEAPRAKKPEKATRGVVMTPKTIEQMNIALAMPGCCNEDEMYIPLLIINNTLGGSMSSRLFQKIREEKGLAYSVYSFTSSYVNSGFTVHYAATGNSQAREVLILIMEELKRIKKDGLLKEEFERSRNQLRASYILGMESTNARMNSLGKSKVLEDKVRTEAQIIARIDKVTEEDVQKALVALFDFDQLCASFVGDTDLLGDVTEILA